MWLVLAGLAVLAIAQAVMLSPQGRAVPYSEFKSLVRSGQVAEVFVGDTVVRGTLKKADGPAAFSTIRIEDATLVAEAATTSSD
jgi:hypothetical protein